MLVHHGSIAFMLAARSEIVSLHHSALTWNKAASQTETRQVVYDDEKPKYVPCGGFLI